MQDYVSVRHFCRKICNNSVRSFCTAREMVLGGKETEKDTETCRQGVMDRESAMVCDVGCTTLPRCNERQQMVVARRRSVVQPTWRGVASVRSAPLRSAGNQSH